MSFKRKRLLLWLLLTIPYLITYFHRVSLNMVADHLMAEFAMSATSIGTLAAVYSYMYLFMQIPGGGLVDRWGPRKIASTGTLLLGIGSLFFALLAGSFGLFTGRLLIGLGGSMILINVFKFQSNWFKANEFGTMAGMAVFIGNFGAIIASRPLAYTVETFGWRWPFIAAGLLSLVIALACYLAVKDTPAEAGFSSTTHVEVKEYKDSPPSNLWAGPVTALQNIHIYPPMLINFGIYGSFMAFSATWGVPYLMQVYGTTRESAGSLMLLAALGMMLGSPLMGFLSDRLHRRKAPVNAALGIYSLMWILLLAWPGGQIPFLLLYPLCFFLGLGTAGIVPINAYAKEISHPAITGSGTATANIGIFLGIAVIQSLFGYLLDYRWEGIIIEGVKYYPFSAYRLGLLLCLFCALLSCGISFFMHETRGQNIYHRLISSPRPGSPGQTS